jgi:hypothetical protein
VHIWEYQGLPGFEKTKKAVKESKASGSAPAPSLATPANPLLATAQGHLQFFNHEILPLIQSRSNQLCQEFAFWQTAQPQQLGGLYELRTYTLRPGALLEWEHEWRAGLEARQKSGHFPAGAWFSQIGELHQVHHLWHYGSLQERKERRAKSWELDHWSQTVAKVSAPVLRSQLNGLLHVG